MGTAMQTLAEGITLCALADTWIEGEAIRQLKQTASLPGMRRVAGMPDLHPGRGYPVGAAFFSVGVIYPTLIGGDIGCGMGLWQTSLSKRSDSAGKLAERLGNIDTPLDASWRSAIASYQLADTAFFSSLGTIGSGNHFAELQRIDEIYDSAAVNALQLDTNCLQLLVHSGSRGLGQAILEQHTAQFGHRPLVAGSEECARYLARHDEALRFATANRALIAQRMLARWKADARQLVDINHNLVSPMVVDGDAGWLHRKGATPAHQGPVVIPGSRGEHSYLVAPIVEAGLPALFSLAHGAGRKWARKDCRGRLERRYTVAQLARTRLGSHVICEDRELLFEEAPEAYKPVANIIDALEQAGLLRKLARFSPVLTYKTRGERCCQ